MFKSIFSGQNTPTDITVYVNDIAVPAWSGEMVSSVLLRVPNAGRKTPVNGNSRLPYCQMGVCFDCLAVVDGLQSVQGCLIPVREGMRISNQNGAREVGQ